METYFLVLGPQLTKDGFLGICEHMCVYMSTHATHRCIYICPCTRNIITIYMNVYMCACRHACVSVHVSCWRVVARDPWSEDTV